MNRFWNYFYYILLAVSLFFAGSLYWPALAGNLGNMANPSYSWAERFGWIRWDGTGSTPDYGANVTSTTLTGYAWSEKTGWINLNDSGSVYGVANDGSGNLSGYAWSEKGGWISFDDSSANNYYQVTISYEGSQGDFNGYAWSEKLGWINMDDAGSYYKVASTWFPVAAPTNVAATDGTYSDKVRVSWTKSSGATGYRVYRDGSQTGGDLGDVDYYDDTGAGAPSITPGSAVASDGTSLYYVNLTLSGTSTSNGTTHTYKVVAFTSGDTSPDSATNTGYRAPGTLTYQWQRSAADSGYTDYSNISGATVTPYDDTEAPADGSGRYYKCVLNASGAAEQTSASNRGYRATLSSPINLKGGVNLKGNVILK